MLRHVGLHRVAYFLFATFLLTVNILHATYSISDSIYLKIEYHSKGYPIAKFTINNKRVLLIIDTGAPCTQFDKSQAEKVGLKWKDTGSDYTGTSFSSTGKLYYTFVESLKHGNVELWSNFHVVSINLSFVNENNKLGEEPVVGILGLDVLSKYKAIIDLESNTIKLRIDK